MRDPGYEVAFELPLLPLGPVHTNPFSNENGAVLLRIRQSSTHVQRRKRSLKTEPFENATRLQFRANFPGRYIEMRMHRVHLSMRTVGITVFSKRIQRCSVNGRKRYKKDKCGRKIAPFSSENGLVWTGP